MEIPTLRQVRNPLITAPELKKKRSFPKTLLPRLSPEVLKYITDKMEDAQKDHESLTMELGNMGNPKGDKFSK